jgi:lincosamide nucleotidyltransferase A/C/D/E
MAMSGADVLEVIDALAEAEIDVSIAGGWAVDALLRRVTREHGDLDIAIDAGSVDRAIGVLWELGLGEMVDERPARVVLTDGSRAVDLHPVVRGADGIGRQMGLAGEIFEYPPGSTDSVGAIGGRPVRCLTPELLVRFHEGYEPRDVDRRDVAALALEFGLPLPSPYGDMTVE